MLATSMTPIVITNAAAAIATTAVMVMAIASDSILSSLVSPSPVRLMILCCSTLSTQIVEVLLSTVTAVAAMFAANRTAVGTAFTMNSKVAGCEVLLLAREVSLWRGERSGSNH